MDGSQDEETDSHGETVFGDSYCEQVASRINAVCRRRISEFVTDVSGRINTFVKSVGEERSRLKRSRAQIWSARATLAGRLVVVVVLLSIATFMFVELAPNYSARLFSVLADRLFDSILVGVLTTLAVLGMVYLVSGAKNENLRRALRPVFLEKWAARGTRRELASALKAHFDESYDRLVDDLAETPLRVDQAIAHGVVEWLKNHSDPFRKSEQDLAELQRLITARCEVFDEFIRVVNQHLDGIPKELRETAGEVKKHAIEEHMSRIRSAADSVEDVKSDVERTAEVARRSH